MIVTYIYFVCRFLSSFPLFVYILVSLSFIFFCFYSTLCLFDCSISCLFLLLSFLILTVSVKKIMYSHL
jgi:hypothetical protein